MKLSHALADSTVFACIDQLSFDATEKDVEKWIDQINTLNFSYQRLCKLSSEVFWSTVSFNRNFVISFESALECIPRGHSLERYQLVYRWNEGAQKAVEALRFQIFIIYYRIHCFPSVIDLELTSSEWLECTQNRDVMPLKRAAQVWALFPNKVDIFAKIISANSQVILNPHRCVKDLAMEIKIMFEHCETAAKQLFTKFSQTKDAQKITAAGLVRKFMYLVADSIFYTLVTLDVLQGASMIKDVPQMINKIPSLIDSIGKIFPVGVLMDIATFLPGWPMRNLLQMNSQIEQGAVRLFRKGLEVIPETKDRYKLIESILRYDRFLFLANEFSAFEVFVSSFSGEERQKIDEAVRTASSTQQKIITKRVEDQGLLQSLGDIEKLQPEQRKALEELKDVFQRMSYPYLHLCLRHFNYNSTYAIESMLSADHNMPMDLRRMQQIDVSRSSNEFLPSLPTVNCADIERLERAVKPVRNQPVSFETREEEKKNVFKGLFSLAPTAPKPVASKNERNMSQPSSSTMPEILQTLRGSLDRNKARVASKNISKEKLVHIGPKGERLVPMHEAKRYAGISKFKTSEEDKVAVRPTYEKFKYETHFEEDDVYEDEYDDGYEQREFQVEPLNERLSEESDAEEGGDDSPKQETADSGRGGARGGRGRGRGGRGGRGGKSVEQGGGNPTAGSSNSNNNNYTGGRNRQMKERHKNEFKQRGADRKRARGMF